MSKKEPINLFEIEQLKAINGFLTHSPDYLYRKICRWFSKTYNTPLAQVLEMPMPQLLQHYYESQVDDADFNHIYELAQTDFLPEFMDDREQEDAEFAAGLIEEQKQTLEKKAQREKKKKQAAEFEEAKKKSLAASSEPPRGTAALSSEKPQSLEVEDTHKDMLVTEFNMDFEDSGNPDEQDE